MLRPSPRRAPLRVQRVHRCWLVGPRPPRVANELDRVIARMAQHPVTDVLSGPHALGATGLALTRGQVLLDHQLCRERRALPSGAVTGSSGLSWLMSSCARRAA